MLTWLSGNWYKESVLGAHRYDFLGLELFTYSLKSSETSKSKETS